MSESESTNKEPATVTLGERPRQGAVALLGQDTNKGPSSLTVGLVACLVVLSLIGNIALSIVYARQVILMPWTWVDVDSVTLTGNTEANFGLNIRMKLLGDTDTGFEGVLKELNADVISVDKVNKSRPEIKLGRAKLTNPIKWKIDKADKTAYFNMTFIREVDNFTSVVARLEKDCKTVETEVRLKFARHKLDSNKPRVISHEFDRDMYATCRFASLLEVGEAHANQVAGADESFEVEVMPAAEVKMSPKHAKPLIRHANRPKVLQATADGKRHRN